MVISFGLRSMQEARIPAEGDRYGSTVVELHAKAIIGDLYGSSATYHMHVH
jgi:hypothetical protein